MNQRDLLLLLTWWPLVACKDYQNNITVNTNPSTRQWGGMATNTGVNNFGGWLVRVRSGGMYTVSCGGAYIAPLLVITSANCIEPLRSVSAGANVVTTANTDIEQFNFAVVDNFYTPDNFKYLSTNMDIALVTLVVPLTGRMTEFIKIATRWPSSGDVMNTFGWGLNSLEVQSPTDHPRKADVTNIDWNKCASKYKKHFVAKTIMCVQQPKDMSNCIYDNGSPLVWKNELIGIASIGSGCRNTKKPSLYTNIKMVNKFITEIQSEIRSGNLRSNSHNKPVC